MKKHKSKSKDTSTNKKVRKELESKLTAALSEVLAQFGKAKKTDKVIEKFVKQLAKKVVITAKDDAVTVFIKEEENAPKTEEVLATDKKAPAKKTKTAKAVS